jgi:hypothetical protein
MLSVIMLNVVLKKLMSNLISYRWQMFLRFPSLQGSIVTDDTYNDKFMFVMQRLRGRISAISLGCSFHYFVKDHLLGVALLMLGGSVSPHVKLSASTFQQHANWYRVDDLCKMWSPGSSVHSTCKRPCLAAAGHHSSSKFTSSPHCTIIYGITWRPQVGCIRFGDIYIYIYIYVIMALQCILLLNKEVGIGRPVRRYRAIVRGGSTHACAFYMDKSLRVGYMLAKKYSRGRHTAFIPA